MKPRGRSPASGPAPPARNNGAQQQGSGRSGESYVLSTPPVLLTTSASDAASLSSTPSVHHHGSVSLHVSPSHRHAAAAAAPSPPVHHVDHSSFPAATAAAANATAGSSSAISTPGGGGVCEPPPSLGNSVFYDGSAGGGGVTKLSQGQQQQLHQLNAKVNKTRQKIKLEQTSQDKNVNEYLKLYSNASNGQQATRIKDMFEKRNQKSAQAIAQLQRKLEEYERRRRDLEGGADVITTAADSSSPLFVVQTSSSSSHHQNVLREKFKDISTKMSSSVMSKPKEFADLLIRRSGGGSGKSSKKNKFGGSADNLSSSSGGSSDKKVIHHGHHQGGGSASLPRDGGGSLLLSNDEGQRKCLSEDGRRHPHRPSTTTSVSVSTSDSVPHVAAATANVSEWNAVMQELALHKEEVQALREGMDELRQQLKQDIETLAYQWRDEAEKNSRLEEQLNDLTELHQNEFEQIRTMVADQQEMALYQNEEGLRDVKESLKMFETKVTNAEQQLHQQQQAQQHLLHVEGGGPFGTGDDARALLMKLITAAITVVHVLLFVAGLLVNLMTPFVRTSARVTYTGLAVALFASYHYQRDYFLAIFRKLTEASSST